MELYEKEEYIYHQIPIRILEHSLERENIYSPLHWHRSIEIALATEGQIELRIDGKMQNMQKDDWSIINSGELHSFSRVEGTNFYKGLTLLVSKSFLDAWLGTDFYLTYPKDIEGQKRIRDVIKKFGKLKMSAGKFYKEELMETLFVLVRLLREYCVIERTEKQSKKQKGIENIKNIVNYVDEHYKENISLNQVAEKFHYSPAYTS